MTSSTPVDFADLPAEALRSSDPSLDHVLSRIAVIETRVRAAVARRRAADPEMDDRFRGLYISDLEVQSLFSRSRDPFWDAAAAGQWAQVEGDADHRAASVTLRLRTLASAFGLDDTDVEILLISLAPDLDARIERAYAYLHDDVSRRRASVGLALELCGLSPYRANARARLSPSAPLVAGALLTIEEMDRPLLTRSLRVPDRVTSHLLGEDAPDPDILPFVIDVPLSSPAFRWRSLERALTKHITPIYLRQEGMADGVVAAAAAVSATGGRPLIIELEHVPTAAGQRGVVSAIVREARLRQATLVLGPISDRVGFSAEVLSVLAAAPCPVVLVGDHPWDPSWSRAVPLVLDVPQPTMADRAALWTSALGEAGRGDGIDGGAANLLTATLAFRLTARQQARAASAGMLLARADERQITAEDLQAGARAQNTAGLDRLAHRVKASAHWSDLILPGDVQALLAELAARARQRERVLDEWQIGGRVTRGRGITGLFAGESGTGKTLAAEVIAGELGLELYVIDLSTIVDKYIGETEKNLDRVFSEADRVNTVLLFDEADAIFGKRSEVRDARDRYANLEVSYLLQRMERFDGLAVLTTNLRANLDDAFTRRIDVIVDFPMPEDESRLALWRMHLPPQLPQAPDLDLEFMARRFRVSGGDIRNICLTAAFLAADADRPVSMADLIRGTEREYRKLGRLTVEAEFGPYLELARPVA